MGFFFVTLYPRRYVCENAMLNPNFPTSTVFSSGYSFFVFPNRVTGERRGEGEEGGLFKTFCFFPGLNSMHWFFIMYFFYIEKAIPLDLLFSINLFNSKNSGIARRNLEGLGILGGGEVECIEWLLCVLFFLEGKGGEGRREDEGEGLNG